MYERTRHRTRLGGLGASCGAAPFGRLPFGLERGERRFATVYPWNLLFSFKNGLSK